jgi:hypothetical protein
MFFSFKKHFQMDGISQSTGSVRSLFSEAQVPGFAAYQGKETATDLTQYLLNGSVVFSKIAV